jgi:SsrA-binding protein
LKSLSRRSLELAKTRKQKKAAVDNSNDRTIAVNRRAFHDYEILEKYEAGLVLTGTEIKSVRSGRVDLRDAYARPESGELWLVNAYIAPYDPASIFNHDPRRPRKLLLHRSQIDELTVAVSQKGLTIVALRIYIKNHVAKAELGLARGKRQYDKRRAIIERELDMAARRAMSNYR